MRLRMHSLMVCISITLSLLIDDVVDGSFVNM